MPRLEKGDRPPLGFRGLFEGQLLPYPAIEHAGALRTVLPLPDDRIGHVDAVWLPGCLGMPFKGQNPSLVVFEQSPSREVRAERKALRRKIDRVRRIADPPFARVRVPEQLLGLVRVGDDLPDLQVSEDGVDVIVLIKIARMPNIAVMSVFFLHPVKGPEEKEKVAGLDADGLAEVNLRLVDLPEGGSPMAGPVLPRFRREVGIDVAMPVFHARLQIGKDVQIVMALINEVLIAVLVPARDGHRNQVAIRHNETWRLPVLAVESFPAQDDFHENISLLCSIPNPALRSDKRRLPDQKRNNHSGIKAS